MNYVVAAYAIIWVFFFVYVFLLARRISGLEDEISRLRK